MVASATQFKTVALLIVLAGALSAASAHAAVHPQTTLALLASPGDRAGEVVAELRLRARDGLPAGFGAAVAFDSGAVKLEGCTDVLAELGASDVSDAYAVLRTTTSGGRFLAYASVVDNRSGDPIYIPAR